MFKDIFISYSSKDENLVKQVVEVFKLNDISYWFAPEQLVGKKHDEEIVPAIKNCKIFLIFLSENSRPREGFATSEWVRDELLTAREYKSFIQPVKLDQTVDHETNNLMFKGLPNYLDMTVGNFSSALLILKELIINLLTDDNYKSKENHLLSFFESKVTFIIKEIETHLQNGYHELAERSLKSNSFVYDYDPEYSRLLEVIIKLSFKPVKDMNYNVIENFVQVLHSLRSSKYENIVYYLEAMIVKSYFEFNGIRNSLTDNYLELKQLSSKTSRIRSKFYMMTRNIQNTIPAKEFELLWL